MRPPKEAYEGGPSALLDEKEFQSEIPQPCRAKRNPGQGTLGGSHAKSLGPAKRKGAPELDFAALARFQVLGWRFTGEILRGALYAAHNRDPVKSQIPRPWWWFQA